VIDSNKSKYGMWIHGGDGKCEVYHGNKTSIKVSYLCPSYTMKEMPQGRSLWIKGS